MSKVKSAIIALSSMALVVTGLAFGSVSAIWAPAPQTIQQTSEGTVELVRVRSSRGKPASMRPGGRAGCCRVNKNFSR